MLVAPRRASLCGATNQLPSCAVVTVTGADAVICGTFVCDRPPRKLTPRAPPWAFATATSVMFGSASSAASIAALSNGSAIGAVVRPSNVSVNVPVDPVGTLRFWVSFVFMSLNGGNWFAPTAPAGVSSPVTSHRLLWRSKSMSPATWQHAPRSTSTFMIFCSLSRSRWAATSPSVSTNLKRESWK